MTATPRSTRRRFLRGSLGLAAAASGTPLAALAGMRQWQHEPRLTLRALAFGTRVSVTVLGPAPREAHAAATAALRRIAEIDAATSLHTPGSALARLNREGLALGADADLLALFRQAVSWGRATAGAFDVTVQPLWRRHFAASVLGRAIPPAELERVRSLVDWRGIRIDGDAIGFGRSGMQATLNGLAQGYASDEAWAVLRAHGVEQGLVDAGEPRAVGLNGDGHGWRIGVRAPAAAPDAATLADLVELRDAALATSGDDGMSFTPDRRLHHILDPGTGVSPPELSAVTVLAPNACMADALSTACMVMGCERSLAFLSAISGVEALLIRKKGDRLATPGWPGRRRS